MLEGFHLAVAQIAGNALEQHEFALGGGYALQAHGVTDRPSKDLDSYHPKLDECSYQLGERLLVEALTGAGYQCRVVRRDSWFRQIVVTNPPSGEQVSIDLGYDYRQHPPIRIQGVGPVLHLDDVIVSKTRALVDRKAERDYSDIDKILTCGHRTPSALLHDLRHIRPEISAVDFAHILRAAHEGDPDEYAAIGVDHIGMQALFGRLDGAADQVIRDAAAALTTPPSSTGQPDSTKRPPPTSPAPSRPTGRPTGRAVCQYCGRTLRSADSIARGYGPGCARRR